jgi:hypothetical protein
MRQLGCSSSHLTFRRLQVQQPVKVFVFRRGCERVLADIGERQVYIHQQPLSPPDEGLLLLRRGVSLLVISSGLVEWNSPSSYLTDALNDSVDPRGFPLSDKRLQCRITGFLLPSASIASSTGQVQHVTHLPRVKVDVHSRLWCQKKNGT